EQSASVRRAIARDSNVDELQSGSFEQNGRAELRPLTAGQVEAAARLRRPSSSRSFVFIACKRMPSQLERPVGLTVRCIAEHTACEGLRACIDVRRKVCRYDAE